MGWAECKILRKVVRKLTGQFFNITGRDEIIQSMPLTELAHLPPLQEQKSLVYE